MKRPRSECCVCHHNDANYTCPTCLINYCSLGCFKSHKTACVVSAKKTTLTKDARKELPSMIFLEDEVDEQDEESAQNKLSQEQLAKLGRSAEVLRVLSNSHLREFLRHADTTHNPRGFLKLAMHEPLFVEFADACLNVVNDTEESKEFSDSQIEEKLCNELKSE